MHIGLIGEPMSEWPVWLVHVQPGTMQLRSKALVSTVTCSPFSGALVISKIKAGTSLKTLVVSESLTAHFAL